MELFVWVIRWKLRLERSSIQIILNQTLYFRSLFDRKSQQLGTGAILDHLVGPKHLKLIISDNVQYKIFIRSYNFKTFTFNRDCTIFQSKLWSSS